VKRPQIGMKGIVTIKVNKDRSLKRSVDKYVDEVRLHKIVSAMQAQPGNLILVVAGEDDLTRKAAAELRLHLAGSLGLRNPDEFKLLWVTDFPLLEFDTEGRRWVARHHPVTAPKPDHIGLLTNNSPEVSADEDYLKLPYA